MRETTEWKNGIVNIRVWTRWFLLLLVPVCLHGADAWATNPSISFANEVMDLGRVPLGRKVNVHCPFTNVGDGTLVIQAIEADLDCTEVYNRNSAIPPRGHGEIITVLDTASLRPGRNERHVLVRSNDSQRPSVPLTMVVEVVRK